MIGVVSQEPILFDTTVSKWKNPKSNGSIKNISSIKSIAANFDKYSDVKIKTQLEVEDKCWKI